MFIILYETQPTAVCWGQRESDSDAINSQTNTTIPACPADSRPPCSVDESSLTPQGLLIAVSPATPALVIRPWHHKVKMIPGGTYSIGDQKTPPHSIIHSVRGLLKQNCWDKDARVSAPCGLHSAAQQAMEQAFNPLPFPRYPLAGCSSRTQQPESPTYHAPLMMGQCGEVPLNLG